MATTIPTTQAEAERAGTIAVINFFCKILSAQVALLIAIGGAIALTLMSLDGNPWKLGAVFIYCLLVVCPTIWLAGKK